MRLKRFTPVQKGFHALLMISFLFQAVTGVARMYIGTAWGKALAAPFGGYAGCLTLHKSVGLFMILLFLCHLVYALFVIVSRKPRREDALWLRTDDIRQFFGHIGWMFGGKQPRFDRWNYWEKFDYWAVFWGMVVLGGTGLLLYNPLATSVHFKGWSLNVALWVHRIEACLAMLHVFIIHFAVVHMRRHNFPMDRAMFCGDTELESAAKEHPAWIARLRAENGLNERTASDVSGVRRVVTYIVGLSAMVIGIYLVIGGLQNAFLVSW